MKIVVIGGGHGASASLQASQRQTQDVAGVISVADDGGSSGRLARELGVLPMGDIRNCLAALAPPGPAVDAFQHRFSSGSLAGHVVGNLVIAGLAQETGSFVAAVEHASEMLGVKAKIVPPTLEPVKLVAEAGGKRVAGQVATARTQVPITRVYLEPEDPKPYGVAIDLISSADMIVLGPGSLFTSVLPPLLVPGVREAYLESRANKVLVCNLTAPPGETADLDAAGHVRALERHLGEHCLDMIILHSGRELRSLDPPVRWVPDELGRLGAKVVLGDLLPESRQPRHDPERLAEVLREL